MAQSRGADLALLLLGGFTTMVDEVTAELAEQGHPGVTATQEFALRAVDEGADSASDLGRALSITKQSAARTIAVLEQHGYVVRTPDAADARRVRLTVTDHGHDMMTRGAALFDEVRDRWVDVVGERRLTALESTLRRLEPPRPPVPDDLP